MALNRRATVTVAEGDTNVHTVRAPGYVDSATRFEVSSGGVFSWLDKLPTPDTFALFEEVWRRSGLAARSLSVSLDSRAFVDTASGRKLGIGSSAAIAVAMAGAFRTISGSSESVLDIAMDAHRSFQKGKGSGVDIATSCHGGTIAYRVNAGIRTAGIPDGLGYRYFWSGVSASTSGIIARFGAGRSSATDAELADAAERVFSLAQGGAAETFLRGMKDYVRALSDFDQQHRLGIFAAGHRALAEKACESPDIVYKPCGAGGGDVGIAMASSTAALGEFAAFAQGEGFAVLDAAVEPRGVLVEAA